MRPPANAVDRTLISASIMDGARSIVGGFIGGVVGSALGAALPIGRGYCTKGQRFVKGLGGATLGGAVAIGLLFVSAPLCIGVAATVPVGAAVAMRKC